MNRLYVNIDINSVVCPFLDKVLEQKNICEEMLYPFVDIYCCTQVTDLLFNIFCQISASPSNSVDSIVDMCRFAKKEHLSDRSIQFMECYAVLQEQYHMDVYQIWIDRCRVKGVNPWISIRMNDCHPSAFLLHEKKDSFYNKAVKNGWVLGEAYGYFKGCYDYRVEEVRIFMLNYIKEQLTRYDVYGVELDFMREIQCFPYLTEDMEECAQIMNVFMRRVRQIVSECELLHGHRIQIAVRLMRDLLHTRYYGMDPETWAKEKLVDKVIPAPRWTGGDSGIPVEEWKEKLSGVKVVAGIDTAVNYEKSRGMSYATAEIARGLAASYLSAGSDGIYLYNYFVNPEFQNVKVDEHTLAAHPFYRNMSVMSSCARLDTIYNCGVRFALLPQADEGFAKTPKMWQPLPVLLDEKAKSFSLVTGKILATKKVMLILGVLGVGKATSEIIEGVEVCINQKARTIWKEIELSFIPGIGSQEGNYVSKETKCFGFEVEAGMLEDKVQSIQIKSHRGSRMLTWLELAVV